MRARSVIVVFALLASVAVTWVRPGGALAFAPPNFRPDFNNDGFADLVVGVPGEWISALGTDANDIARAGAVNVAYGSLLGLTGAGAQFWNQNVTGMAGDGGEADDYFGASTATGDFNDDGYDDLAIGIPRENVGSVSNAGAVAVLNGSAAGLTVNGNQFFTQADASGSVEAGDEFGFSLTTGDFDKDGYADLAIGARTEDAGSDNSAGAVNVMYGGATGLGSGGEQQWTQSATGVGSSEDGDEFGFAVAGGDFDNDGYDDLAIGTPMETLYEGSANPEYSAGAVTVLYGSSSKLVNTGAQMWTQDGNIAQSNTDIPGGTEDFDQFGFSLAVGDFDYDFRADLAIGVVAETVGTDGSAGAVNVLYGGSSALTHSGAQLWHQDSTGVQGTADSFDEFGFALTAGDFDGDNAWDLAVGIINEIDSFASVSGGGVQVLYGSVGGGVTARDELWTQNVVDVGDVMEGGDQFGYWLAAANYGDGSRTDLVIGVPFEDGSTLDDGMVHVLYGRSPVGNYPNEGLSGAGSDTWTQASFGQTRDPGDSFGCRGLCFQ